MQGAEIAKLRRRLLAWYGREARALPWRGQDLYGVWVSEAMLQQTRVDVVVPYYLAWMRRWPTVQDLARADPEDVARQWAGLGYYARARNLHAAARRIAEQGWPRDLQGWRELPGVGPYTAAAVTSIALGQPNACIDGNVVRVVARLAGIQTDVKAAATRRRIAALAQAWLAPQRPGEWNQAVMDLGATVCTPRAPRCPACPVADLCRTKANGLQAKVPRVTKARAPVVESRAVALVRRGGRVLLVRAPTGLLAGMWTLPGGPTQGSLVDAVRQQAGVEVEAGDLLGQASHTFSHRVWHMQVHAGRVVGIGRRRPSTHDVRWVAESRLEEEAVPAATRAALAAGGIAAKPKTAAASATS